MKPVIISTICIVFLIFIWSMFYYNSGITLNEFSSQLSESLYNYISEENWEAASLALNNLSEKWEKRKTWFYMLSYHGVVREVDISFSRLSEFIKDEEASDAHAEIGTLKELFLSIRQGEAFTIDNIL